MKDHPAEVMGGTVGFVTGALVFTACTGLSLGVGVVGCAVIAGAAGGAVGGLVSHAMTEDADHSLGGYAKAGVAGAVLGAATGGIGSGIASLGGKLAAGALTRTVSGEAAGSGAGAVRAAIGSVVRRIDSRVARVRSEGRAHPDRGSVGIPGGRGYTPRGAARDFDLDELAQFAHQHVGAGDIVDRPSFTQKRTTLDRGAQTDLGGRMQLDYRGVRVIINEKTPWRSTAFTRNE